MKLIYIWCEKYNGIEDFNLNISKKYKLNFDSENKILNIKKNNIKNINIFNIDQLKNKIPIDITAIIGKNGSGKTTVLKILSDILYKKGIMNVYRNKNNTYDKYIIAYEKNEELYIVYPENLVDKIVSEDQCHEKQLHCNNKSEILEIEDLNKICTLYISNTLTHTYEKFSFYKNFYNFSTRYLLQGYLSNDQYVKVLFKKKNKNNDFLINNLIGFDNEMMKLYFDFLKINDEKNIFKSIGIEHNYDPKPKLIKIRIDYYETNEIRRFENKNIDKFYFENYINDLVKKENTFINNVYQRVSELMAEKILNVYEESSYKKKLIIKVNKLFEKSSFGQHITLINYRNILLKLKSDFSLDKIVSDDDNKEVKNIKDKSIDINEKIIKEMFETIANTITYPDEEISIKNISQQYEYRNKNKLPYLRLNLDKSECIYSLIDINIKIGSVIGEYPMIFNYEGISSGEMAYLEMFAKLYKFYQVYNNDCHGLIVILDELDIYLHPEWKRQYIYSIICFFEKIFENNKFKYIHIILASNSPFLISDLSKENIIYLKKENDICKIYDNNNYQKTFGANIHTLLANSFYMNNTIGKFASQKIRSVAKDLNEKSKKEILNMVGRKEEIKYIIKNIGEPVIKRKLEQMYKETLLENTEDYQSKIKQLEKEKADMEKLLNDKGLNKIENIMELLNNRIKELKENIEE